MKKILSLYVLLGLLFALPVTAQPGRIPAEVEPSGQLVQVPQVAVDSSPSIVPLGSAIDPKTGKKVEGVMFIHRKDLPTHRPNHPGSGGTTSRCFAYISKGAKWKTVEPWVVNPVNIRGLEQNFILSNLTSDIATWEDAADGFIDGGSVNILGDGATTLLPLTADTTSPDGQNEVYFGNVSGLDVIAVTIVWGNFAGPPSRRELVEWDQVYDQVDFDWSAIGEAGKMDFANIATHELGHSTGMDHPSDSCTEETEYRFSANGEIKKRTLNAGDIAGINGLY